ncbi:MAG: hypothetical protein ACK4S4_10765 [Pyrinomonadaceae bacterium]
MNTRVVAATVAGGIVLFFLGWLAYGILLADFMKAHTVQYAGLNKEPMPDMVPLVLSNLAISALMAIVFDHWASIRTFKGGLIGGGLIMLLVALYVDLAFLAFMNLLDLTVVLVDVVVATLLGAITGGVIGQVLGMMGPRTADA